MRLYGIAEEEILLVLSEPEHTSPSRIGRINAWRRRPTGWLRVTYVDEDGRRVIITVTPRRRGPTET